MHRYLVCPYCLWPLLGPSSVALRYVMDVRFYGHGNTGNAKKSVYSKRVIREQHGFDSAVCTQTVPRSTGVPYSNEECSGLISLS